MKKTFDLPQFISAWEKGSKEKPAKKYDVNDFGPAKPGFYTHVQGLDDLPPSVLERIPGLSENKNGFVIKKYRNERLHLLFEGFDYKYLLDGKKRGNSPIEAANLLEQRQKMLLKYLGDDSDLILSSHFIVNVDEKNKPALFEIQERLPHEVTLANLGPIFDLLEDETFRQTLTDNLRKLLRVIERMIADNKHPYFSAHLPDWSVDNFFITRNGEIKIFDNNLYWEKDDPEVTKRIMSIRSSIISLLSIIERGVMSYGK